MSIFENFVWCKLIQISLIRNVNPSISSQLSYLKSWKFSLLPWTLLEADRGVPGWEDFDLDFGVRTPADSLATKSIPENTDNQHCVLLQRQLNCSNGSTTMSFLDQFSYLRWLIRLLINKINLFVPSVLISSNFWNHISRLLKGQFLQPDLQKDTQHKVN